MPAATRERDEIGERRRRLDQLGLGRPAPSHRDHDDVAVAGEQPREMRRDGGLADALAGADHRDRRQLERLVDGRVEAEVGADVRQAGRERARGPAEALGRAEHRLVREVDDHLGVRRSRRRAGRRSRRRRAASRVPPTRIAPTHSYGSSASASRTTGAIVLAVDQGDGLVITASSSPRARSARCTSRTRAVARSNWMIRSCPWNG